MTTPSAYALRARGAERRPRLSRTHVARVIAAHERETATSYQSNERIHAASQSLASSAALFAG